MAIAKKNKYRPINYVSTAQTSSNIDSFGSELAAQYAGNMFFICNPIGIGRSFLAYKIEGTISINGIYAESLIDGGKNSLISALVASVVNIGAALNRDIEIKLDQDSMDYIAFANNLYKISDVEEVYWWKIQD